MKDATGSGQELQADQAFEALIAALRQGALRANEFITMPQLVESLGYPIAATREAVKRAETQSLVSILPKRGIVVMDASPETTRACLDMRALLDKEGACRLIRAGTPLPLNSLRGAHEDMLQQAQSGNVGDLPAQALQTDLSLHDLLANGLDNPFLRSVYDANRNRLSVIQAARAFLVDRIVSAMEEHLAIIAALRAQDTEQVARAVDHHCRQTMRWWGVDER
ncbi:GntR family transcriptional regulator [Leisingera daeponensis]|uniref:GntR family transcriptional regulator n=1 Tax=Leisingera daeponensis TaxID=405746 RepID=A0ABS7NJ46_9RHOB|nr:GntR family transcriptional regulator [Leisingera daeponensis]MBY6058198.1 GntR family transcriptional regulator [Leisingera daeponensis]MBY6141223.1 GntR family transcriptional regulator [Leisingera daeponensis]